MRKISRRMLTLLLLPGLCWANELTDMGPKWNFERADVVLIGTAISLGHNPLPERPRTKAMEIAIEVVMKGKVDENPILVPYGQWASEARCKDGMAGQRYLLLLRKSGTSRYYIPIDGCYGVMELHDTRVRY